MVLLLTFSIILILFDIVADYYVNKELIDGLID
jgi:hypothetical protein